jgi:adenylate cyclase
MTDVFISYARSTAPAAKRVADAVRTSGHSVWMDEQLPAHGAYADEIAERLDSARAVIVIWSRAAAQSDWVRSEADRARLKGTLVQVSVDGSPMPMPFDQIQCIDLSDWSGDLSAAPWQRVRSSLIQLMSPDEDPAPALAPVPVSPAIPSVAVLPFKDLSERQDQDYFCEGIAEEILNALARLPGLRVAASAMGTTESSDGGLAVARSLGVRAFLQGSVRKFGEQARVGVRLVETSSGFTLWTDSFDRSLTDIFEVQDEIARAIVAALGIRLLAGDSAGAAVGGTTNPQAYDLYLRARRLVRKELESEGRTAAELFRQATREDPQFALAFAGLADALASIARWRLSGWKEAEQEAVAAAQKAVTLAPTMAEAHLAHGASLRLSHDPGARAAYQLALQLSPEDPHVHYRFARFLVLEDEKVEAIAHYERAFALAPDDYRYIVFALQEYQALGDAAGEQSCLERASDAIERHLAVNPEDARAYGHGAGVLALLGKSDEANRYIARALAFRPDDYGNLVTLACAASLNHDPDQALHLLERAVSTGRGDREWMLADNDLKPLHGHPRFEALLQRME